MLIRNETAPQENKDDSVVWIDPPPCSIQETCAPAHAHAHTHTHTQVHPIFVLSIADGMLAVLWVVGGALWLKGGVSQSRVGCFAVSLMTVVSMCGWVGVGWMCVGG